EEYEAVANFLEQADWWERLSKPIPQMVPHKEWFSKIREIILEEPEEEQAQPVIGVSRIKPKAKSPKNGKA
ncbi:hypothetical protein EB061_13475, partial [bacterium]|nr:hypothetical protein [bacterium]